MIAYMRVAALIEMTEGQLQVTPTSGETSAHTHERDTHSSDEHRKLRADEDKSKDT